MIKYIFNRQIITFLLILVFYNSCNGQIKTKSTYDLKNADTIISGYNSGQTNPSIMYSTDEDGIVSWNTGGEKMGNRQDLNTVFQRSGNIYVIKSDLIKSRKIYGDSIYAIEIPKERAISIDDLMDFSFAKFLITQKK